MRSSSIHRVAGPRGPGAMLLATLGLALVCGLVGPASARAQRRGRAATAATTDTADTADADRARSLFAEGVSLVAESNFVDAEVRFRQALALRSAPAIRYNLASVLYEQGEYPEAQVLNEQVLADGTAPAPVREAATQLRAHILERAGHVRLELQGDALGGEVSLDGYVLVDAGLEIPVSPQAHVVVVTRDGVEVARRELQVEQGARRVITVAPAAPEGEPAQGGPGRSVDQEEWFWPVIGGSAVAVVVVIGVVVGVAATSGTEGPVEGNFMPGVIRWP